MAAGDILDLFTGWKVSNDVLRIQLQMTGSTNQIRAGLLNGAQGVTGAWADTNWYDPSTSSGQAWIAIEISYAAFANSRRAWVKSNPHSML